MKRKRIPFILLSIILAAGSAWSAELTATVTEVNGKVEAKSAGGAWAPVQVGDILIAGDSISTGFSSKAVMILGDSSVLIARDLTRLTLTELYEKEGTVKTDLFLDVGNVRTEVHSSDSVSHDFQIRNANSTASVRGTVLDVEILGDGRGMKVMAWDGMAVVTDVRSGRRARVGEEKQERKSPAEEEESSETNLGLPPEPPAEIAAAPLLASGNGGGMVSPMATAMAASSVTVSTKPPSPTAISTGGGSSATTEAASAAAALTEEPGIESLIPTVTTSRVSIEIIWPQ